MNQKVASTRVRPGCPLPLPGVAGIVSLREITASDREFLFQLYATSRAEELAQTGWTELQKGQFLRMQFQAQDTYYRQNYAGAEFLAVTVDGAGAGRLYLQRGEREWRIMDITLAPVFQRRGIGGGLLRLIQEEAGESGVCLTIHVEVFNPARRLYERLGFAPVETNNQVYIRMEWRTSEGPPAGN